MATTIVNPEPSMADLRGMLAASEPTETEVTPEPVVKADPVEADKAPVETKQEPIEKDEPLPENVQKRIAKEVERQAKADRAIAEAVSNRKAAEDKLANLAGKPGSEPEPNTAQANKAPAFGEKGHEEETYAQYQQRDREHLRAEIQAETRKTLEQEFTARQQETAAKVKWDAAIEAEKQAGTIKDGKEFSELMAKAQEVAPEGLQAAISSLENWSGVAVHLAKDPAKLAELAEQFKANPYAAIAKLGRIEASLKTASKPAAVVLPDPPAKVGGGANASSGAFDFEGAKMSQLRRHAGKLGLLKAG